MNYSLRCREVDGCCVQFMVGFLSVLFVSCVLLYLCQAFIITHVARFLHRLRFILFICFVLDLFLLVLVYSLYYGTSLKQHFCNSWRARNLLVMMLMVNKLGESIVSLHTRLLRPSTNFGPFLHRILHSSRVVDNAREDPFPLTLIFITKEIPLR